MSKGYTITLKKVKKDLRYTVRWSPYYRMEKYIIRNHIPAEGGVFQVYRKEGHGLSLLITDFAFYGGLRGTLRELIDPLCPRKYPMRDTMMKDECYVRYAITSLQRDMEYVKAFLVHGEAVLEEGEEIFVNEVDNLNIKRENPQADLPTGYGKRNYFVGADVNKK